MTSGYLQEEPDAGKPPVRICEGESRMAELLDFKNYQQRGKRHEILYTEI